MLAYRHAFHAGNHADVLKHFVLTAVFGHLREKSKGWRYVDTHAGAGGYSLEGGYAATHREYEGGIGRLLNRAGREPMPEAVALHLRPYLELAERYNGSTKKLRQYPGSPAIAHAFARAQDQLRLFELHPTEHKILAGFLGSEPGCEVRMVDGFAALKSVLPPPTRRGVVLIDPPYELKTDYTKTLGALREALARFPEGIVIVWLPQVRLVEATQLPRRLEAAAASLARKGWVHARMTVAEGDERGFGLLGSSVFVANPPHTLPAALQAVVPWLARELAQFDGARGRVERSAQG